MSVYNGAPYVQASVESILNQTFEDFEFIIIDDGSKDRTSEIINSFDDQRIILLANESNLGLAKSLNLGIVRSRGEYIARQDSDDISHADRLSRQIEYLDQHPHIGIVGSAVQWIDSQGSPIGKIWPLGGDNSEIQQLLMHICPLIHGSTMYRRQCFSKVGGYAEDMPTGQDYDLWLRISEGWDIVCLPDVLYSYRQHEEMASIKQRVEQAQHAKSGVERAIKRRFSYAKLVFGIKGRDIPQRISAKGRTQLAERYTWWSAGARLLHRWVAIQLLLIALLFDPTSEELRQYINGIISRKLRLGIVAEDKTFTPLD